jgi:hypothetical protein
MVKHFASRAPRVLYHCFNLRPDLDGAQGMHVKREVVQAVVQMSPPPPAQPMNGGTKAGNATDKDERFDYSALPSLEAIQKMTSGGSAGGGTSGWASTGWRTAFKAASGFRAGTSADGNPSKSKSAATNPFGSVPSPAPQKVSTSAPSKVNTSAPSKVNSMDAFLGN